jgi:hypothetical protein
MCAQHGPEDSLANDGVSPDAAHLLIAQGSRFAQDSVRYADLPHIVQEPAKSDLPDRATPDP